jgi:DNA-binding transcriptional LysR family regulator
LAAAARELGMSPAMATKHLDALEQRLGVTLVRRSTRRLSLTEAGRNFLVETDQVLGGLAEAEARASSATMSIKGLLRVSTPVSFGVMHLAPLVGDFMAAHPDLTIELGLNDHFVDVVEEGWDVVIRIGKLDDSSLIARKIAPLKPLLCASPAYLEVHGVPRTVADLQHHNCLGYTLTIPGGTKSWSFGRDGGITTPIRGNLQANSGEALVAAAIAGLGLVYGPHYIASAALAEGRLVALTLDVPMVEFFSIYAVTHPDRRPTRKAKAWIDHLAAALPKRLQ